MSINDNELALRAKRLRDRTIAATIARLLEMLNHIFFTEEYISKILKKREGQEVQLHFIALDTIITLNLSKAGLKPYLRSSDKAVATIILTMEKEDIIPSIIYLMRAKNNFSGLMKIVFKYVLTGKIKLKGSKGAVTKIIKLLSMGSHPMFSRSN